MYKPNHTTTFNQPYLNFTYIGENLMNIYLMVSDYITFRQTDAQRNAV